ncbi:hypothetical protein BDW69DRAFT_90884 [Aspergillus filifer]
MGQSPSIEHTAIADNTAQSVAMARLGRDDGSVSFPPSPKPVRRKRKTTPAMMSAPEHGDSVKSTKATNGNMADTSSKHVPPTKPANLSIPAAVPAEDNNNADLPSSAPSNSDLYAPLLTYICEHTFMRHKKYPVPRSSRIQFVLDVNGEGKRLGYDQAVIDRVVLDIKRYYLVNVGWGHAFTEGAEFGLEFDDTLTKPRSETAGVSKDKGFSTGKISEGLPLGTEFLIKRQSAGNAGFKASRPPIYRYGLDPFDLNDIIDDGLSSSPGREMSTGPKNKTVAKGKQVGGLSLKPQPSPKRMFGGTASLSTSAAPEYNDYLDRFDLKGFLRDDVDIVDKAELSKPQEPQGNKRKRQKKRKPSGSSDSAPSKAVSGSQKNTSKNPKSNAAAAKKKKSTISVKVEAQESLQEPSRSGTKQIRQRATSIPPPQQAAPKTKYSAKNAKHGAAFEDPIVLDF